MFFGVKAIRVKIYPNAKQSSVLDRTFGCARFVYNWALAKKVAIYNEDKKTISKWELSAELTKLKRDEDKQWLNEVPSQVLQQVLGDLDSAFSHFFKKKAKFPAFKSKKHARKSFRIPQGFEVNRDAYYIKLPKVGWVRFKDEFNVPETVEFRSITVSCTGNKYFASILYDDHCQTPGVVSIDPDKTVGVDLGVKTYATLSNGTSIENPKHLAAHLGDLKTAHRKLSKLKEGTSSYRKQKLAVGKVYEKVGNSRRDFLNKFSTTLVENQDVTTYCIEDLAVQNMQQTGYRSLSRAIGDTGWRMFRTMMEYKCADRGKNLIVIGRFEASSRTCTCGHLHHGLTLKDRSWTCPVCAAEHDRDQLAARNIRVFGLRKAGLGLSSISR